MQDEEDHQMKSANHQADEPKLVRGKIVSFVRYGDEVVGISQLGIGVYRNFKTNSFKTFNPS